MKTYHCKSYHKNICIGYGERKEFKIIGKGRSPNMCENCWRETLKVAIKEDMIDNSFFDEQMKELEV